MDQYPNNAVSLTDLFPGTQYVSLIMHVQNCLSNGNIQDAQKSVAEQIRKNSDSGLLHYLMSEIMVRSGRSDVAIQAAGRAIEREPDNQHFRAQHAHSLLHSAQFKKALELARRCWNEGVEHPITADLLGSTFTGCGELSEALRAYRTAASMAPDVSNFQFNLATALRAVGNLKEAGKCYDKVIDANPRDWQAHRNRSDLYRQTHEHNHVAEMEALLPLADSDRRAVYQLCGALSKELEDLGDYEKSWHYLSRSNRARRSLIRYNVESDIGTIKALIREYDAGYLQQKGGYPTSEPIFILGLPRTGSTLLERMVSSNSEVFSAGELQNFANQLVSQARRKFGSRQIDKISLVQKSKLLDFTDLGRSYIESTRPRTGHTRFFIDKMPMNFLYIGLIRLALPEAKIIHMKRHPMDTCYAILKTPFENAYPFSYDTQDIARYYVAYHRLMDHWNLVFTGNICNVEYEKLVTNPEQEVRRVMDYCGLRFEPACLEFYKSDTPTNTASASQVREPIYQDSIKKWLNYEKELKPVVKILEESGIVIEQV